MHVVCRCLSLYVFLDLCVVWRFVVVCCALLHGVVGCLSCLVRRCRLLFVVGCVGHIQLVVVCGSLLLVICRSLLFVVLCLSLMCVVRCCCC